MATQLLAAGLTEADSDPVTLAAGAVAILFLTGPAAQVASPGYIAIQFETSVADTWSNVYELGGTERRTARIEGPVKFRVHRPARDERSLSLGVNRA